MQTHTSQSTEHTQTDHELMVQIQQQNREAFETLFARYRPLILRHIQGIVRNQTASEDLLQEVFLKVWTRAEQWHGGDDTEIVDAGNTDGMPTLADADKSHTVKPWIYRIATNLSLNHLRSQKRRPQQPLDTPLRIISGSDGLTVDEDFVPGWMIDQRALQPEVMAVTAEKQRLLRQLVNELPEDKQEVFRLVYDQEMDLRSVANELGIPEGTVKSRLYYSKRTLAKKWNSG